MLVIKQDHDLVRQTYDHYKRSIDDQERIKLSNLIIKLVAVHSVAEEIVLYPVQVNVD